VGVAAVSGPDPTGGTGGRATLGGRVPRLGLALGRRAGRLLRSSDDVARREPDAGRRRRSSALWEAADEPWRRLRLRLRWRSVLLLLSLLSLSLLSLLPPLLLLSLLSLLLLLSLSPAEVVVVLRRR